MRRALILLLGLTLLLALLLRQDISSWPFFQRWTSGSASTNKSRSASGVSDNSTSATPTAQAVASSSSAPSSSPAELAAAAWLTRAKAVTLAWRTKKFGPQVAALMARPPDEAWPKLKALAAAGDINAAAAAALLAIECGPARAALAEGPPGKGTMARILFKGLPQERIDLLQAIDDRGDAEQFARYAACMRIDTTSEFWDLAAASMRDDNPDLQLYEAGEMGNDADAIALLRDLAKRMGTDDARCMLAERLLRSVDSAQQREGRELLEAMAVDDPRSLGLLANCLRNGCGHFTGDADVAQDWLQRAAGGGDWSALTQLVADFSAAHNEVEAWAWARYRLELANAACFNGTISSNTWLAESIRTMQHLDETLSTAQRIEAEGRWRALSARWLVAARTNQACSP